jgi:hypothetical protein
VPSVTTISRKRCCEDSSIRFKDELRAALGFTCEDAMILEDAYTERIKGIGIDSAVQIGAIIILRGKEPQDPEVAAIVDEVRAQVPASDVRLHVIWKAVRFEAHTKRRPCEAPSAIP